MRRALLTFPNRAEGRDAGTAGADAGARQQGAAGDGEAACGETPFFAGEALSVADIALYAYTHDGGEGGFDLAAYPAVTRLAGPRRERSRAMCR